MATTTTGVDLDVAKPLALSPFDPRNWYWKRKSGKLLSSARVKEVSGDDPDFQAWSDGTRFPTPYPLDESGDESEVEMQRVLDPYNLSATLPHYVRAAMWKVRTGGTTIGETFVPTDSDTLTLLNGLRGLAEQNPDGKFPFDDGTATGIVLTSDQAKGLAIAVGQWVQSTFDKRIELLTAVEEGALTDKADVDEAIAPSAKPTKKKTIRAKA